MTANLPENNSIVVATGADDAFALPMGVSLYSLLSNLENNSSITIYIIDGGISERNRLRLREILNVDHVKLQLKWLQPESSQMKGLEPYGWVHSQATYLRLMIPDLLPKECSRVIYLDSDLVVESNLRLLWEQDIETFDALGIPNFTTPVFGDKKDEEGKYRQFGLSGETPFCNAGVLVMNLKRWRAGRIGERALELARRFSLPEGDQDAINIVIGRSWGCLDPRWNVQVGGIDEYKEILKRLHHFSNSQAQSRCDDLLSRPHIMHFTSRLKPWHFLYAGPGRSRFFHYLARNRWFGSISDMSILMQRTWEEQSVYDAAIPQANQTTNDEWIDKSYKAYKDLQGLISSGTTFIVADESTRKWAIGVFEDCRILPFVERDGEYWGPPANDLEAINELERLRDYSARFVVFSFAVFWWLEHYSGFHAYLHKYFPCVLRNERLVIYDLQRKR